MPQPARQDSQFLCPALNVLRTHIHQHDWTTISTDHQSQDLRLSTSPYDQLSNGPSATPFNTPRRVKGRRIGQRAR
jgi:hypothetical protein